MDIDQEHLAIPDTEYAATVGMPSAEFSRICRDLNALSESGMEGNGSPKFFKHAYDFSFYSFILRYTS